MLQRVLPGSSAPARQPSGTCRKHAYGCFLPDLTRFTARHCRGPDLHHRTTRQDCPPERHLGGGFSPAIADCGSSHRSGNQGTASAPLSTASLINGRKSNLIKQVSIIPLDGQGEFTYTLNIMGRNSPLKLTTHDAITDFSQQGTNLHDGNPARCRPLLIGLRPALRFISRFSPFQRCR